MRGDYINTLNIESKLADKYGYKPLKKDLSKKYRNLYKENIPDLLKIDGDNINLYTLNGSLICKGYNRIVIGDYGAFIEYEKELANDNYVIKQGQEYRINDPKYSKNVKYHWYTIDDNSNIKIYWQRKTVTYADYKKDMYYISPHEIKIIS